MHSAESREGKAMIAVCRDECGDEQFVDCPGKDTKQIPVEWTFRYWQQFTALELAYDRQQGDGDYYNPEEDY